jgi:hypothetical protein
MRLGAALVHEADERLARRDPGLGPRFRKKTARGRTTSDRLSL